ncbi:class I SAM-dependent methyltransferase [Nocardia sp. alder85J]|uniref:class I SAM-dependent methyltransferase n=1 Tax=Nocardia sp. alder85J TaxID=2862949 RepID=UPI001CD70409|nr:class I SAM-dependent methyltransferase [Nocardia sp. alder85J]MCX4096290.1 methyltransferase domain-containing protein [Nocardia sp. alder85J]
MTAADWDARYAHSELVWGTPPHPIVAEQATALQRSLLPSRTGEPPRALDLGCGEGRHTLWLATHGWQVTAVDFSQVGIDKGRTLAARLSRSARGRITWHCADVTDPAAGPDGPFELVLLTCLHLPPEQRRAVLRRAADLLIPDGLLLVLGHDPADPVAAEHDPATLFTPEDILRDLACLAGQLRERVADRVSRADADHPDILVLMTRIAPGDHGTIAL